MVNPPELNVGASDGLPEAYTRLRRIAGRLMRGERASHTLTPTDVVHEAMARLLASGDVPDRAGWGGEPFADFARKAARAMTEVLVDHARRRGAAKRGGGRGRVSLDDAEAAIESPGFDWLALDEALREMEARDPRRHSVVVLRFFAGLDNRQIARELGVDERTVGRDWVAARLWLKKRLGDGSPAPAADDGAAAGPGPEAFGPRGVT